MGGGGGGGGQAVFTAASCRGSSKARGRRGLGASQVHSHLEVALGQEAGKLGYSLETGRIWGALEGHLEAAVSVCPLPVSRVILRACSGRGLQTCTAFTAHPPAPRL